MNEDTNVPLVITSGDEGLQLNSGCRLGFVGSGFQLSHFESALKVLRQLFASSLCLASAQEDDWLERQLQSRNQSFFAEKLTAFAQQQGLAYVGQFDYGDPKDLEAGVRGHLVRPPKIHVAEGITLTIGGGEQTYSLERCVICADFAHGLDLPVLRELMISQIDFYREIVGAHLPVSVSDEGNLSPELKLANRQALSPILAACN
ncbi:hypothetical protein IJJ08_03090 [bacterium]|nr:hypothetical protein [bacterium]